MRKLIHPLLENGKRKINGCLILESSEIDPKDTAIILGDQAQAHREYLCKKLGHMATKNGECPRCGADI